MLLRPDRQWSFGPLAFGPVSWNERPAGCMLPCCGRGGRGTDQASLTLNVEGGTGEMYQRHVDRNHRSFSSRALSVLVATLLVGLACFGLTGLTGVAYSGGIVTTDQADYSPEQIVTVSGNGFAPSASYDVVVIRPDGSIVKGDGSFRSGWDTVQSNLLGNFTYLYQLDGIMGTSEVRVYPTPWSGDLSAPALAGMTFTDAAKVDLDQCRNGGVVTSGTQTFVQCTENPAGDTNKGWVNGNAGS